MLYHTPARHKVSTFVLGFISAVAVIAGAGAFILSYLERGNSAQQLATLNDRTNLWKIALGDYMKRPFFGYGLGAARGIFLEQIKLGGGHNAFINVLTDQGGLGMVVFVSLLAVILWRILRYPKGSIGYRESYLLVPLFIGLLVNSISCEFMATQANNAAMWLFMICAWVTVIGRGAAQRRRGRCGSRRGAAAATAAGERGAPSADDRRPADHRSRRSWTPAPTPLGLGTRRR